jgi:subtilase family serine protease
MSRISLALLAATSVPALAAPVNKAALPLAAADTPVGFDVYLPLRDAAGLDALVEDQQKLGSANYHKWLTPDEFKLRFGPTGASMSRAQAGARAAGLQITRTGTRSFHVTAPAATVMKALGTSLKVAVEPTTGRTRLFATGMTLPASLKAEGAQVLSFTSLPLKQPFAMKSQAKSLGASPSNRYGPDGPYWYNDLKQAYHYPSYQSILPNGQRLDGTGVSVAILMSDLLFPQDVAAFFNHENFTKTTGKLPPVVKTELINGGGAIDGPGSFEASLDVQQVLGGAPGSSVTLISLPDLSDDNILAGYGYIVDENRFDVVNSSFGACEALYTKAYNDGVDYTSVLGVYDDIFKQGNAQGITFVASSGDNAALQCPSVDYFSGSSSAKFVKGVSTPASSPRVTAVGGGNLVTIADGTLSSNYFAENGYGDPLIPYDPYGNGTNLSGGYWGAGGGVSKLNKKPAYQYFVTSGSDSLRTLPDVGMQVGGCPGGISQLPCGPDRSAAITAYGIGTPAGGYYGVIGTSVSSPEFVGALALYIQQQGRRQGNINYFLYSQSALQTSNGGTRAPADLQFYRRNQPGFDGAYNGSYPSASYNFIYGNGSPDVRRLFGFTDYKLAGTPQTSSNP